jgi:hypothetical protein
VDAPDPVAVVDAILGELAATTPVAR